MENKIIRILITGATGLLGKYIIRDRPKDIHYQILGTYLTKSNSKINENFRILDISKPNDVSELFSSFKPNVVIHTASNGSVDFTEKNKELVHSINLQGSSYIIKECKKYNSKLIFISSNAVYEGTSPPYSENSSQNPVNYYGLLKHLTEIMVRESGLDFVILRPILMYGMPVEGGRDNPVTWWIKNFKEGKSIQVVNDVVTMPLYAGDCARVCWDSIISDKHGEFNIAGSEKVTLYDFALKVCDVFSFSRQFVTPVSSDYFKDLAPRPSDTSYNISKFIEEFKLNPMNIRDGLLRLKSELNL